MATSASARQKNSDDASQSSSDTGTVAAPSTEAASLEFTATVAPSHSSSALYSFMSGLSSWWRSSPPTAATAALPVASPIDGTAASSITVASPIKVVSMAPVLIQAIMATKGQDEKAVNEALNAIYKTNPDLNVRAILNDKKSPSAFLVACRENLRAAFWMLKKSESEDHKERPPLDVNALDGTGIHALTEVVLHEFTQPAKAPSTSAAGNKSADTKDTNKDQPKSAAVNNSADVKTDQPKSENDTLRSQVFNKLLARVLRTGTQSGHLKNAFHMAAKRGYLDFVRPFSLSSFDDEVLRQAMVYVLRHDDFALAEKIYNKLKNKTLGIIKLIEVSREKHKDDLLRLMRAAKNENPMVFNSFPSPIKAIVHAFCLNRWSYSEARDVIIAMLAEFDIQPTPLDIMPIFLMSSVSGAKLWRDAIGTQDFYYQIYPITENYTNTETNSEVTVERSFYLSNLMVTLILNRKLSKEMITAMAAEHNVDLSFSYTYTKTHSENTYKLNTFPDMRGNTIKYNVLDFTTGVGNIAATKALLEFNICVRNDLPASFIPYVAREWGNPLTPEDQARAQRASCLVNVFNYVKNGDRGHLIPELQRLKRLPDTNPDLAFLENQFGQNKLWNEVNGRSAPVVVISTKTAAAATNDLKAPTGTLSVFGEKTAVATATAAQTTPAVLNTDKDKLNAMIKFLDKLQDTIIRSTCNSLFESQKLSLVSTTAATAANTRTPS